MTELEGRIFRALSGFYDVDTPEGPVRCKARGRFRRDSVTPLVGDLVRIAVGADGNGTVRELLPRKNDFLRPPVANIDKLVVVAAAVIPVTDPFLLDRILAIAEMKQCAPVICINKTDMDPGDALFEIYRKSGFETIRTSAETGEGIDRLRETIAGSVCAFTGNSGVGKSSILNALDPTVAIPVGDVSEKLGRGRHTTRHVELYRLSCGALVADTPGFSAFDTERMESMRPAMLQDVFREFQPHLGACRFADCAHIHEPGCGVLEALERGEISPSRHESYVRLYEQLKQIPEWEQK